VMKVKPVLSWRSTIPRGVGVMVIGGLWFYAVLGVICSSGKFSSIAILLLYAPDLFVIGLSCGCLCDSGFVRRLVGSDAVAGNGLRGVRAGVGGVLVNCGRDEVG
jgi:hypothetical protein